MPLLEKSWVTYLVRYAFTAVDETDVEIGHPCETEAEAISVFHTVKRDRRTKWAQRLTVTEKIEETYEQDA